MKITLIFFSGILVGAVLLNPPTARADAAPRFREEAQSPTPAANDAPTAQEHLAAARNDLNRALAALQKATTADAAIGNYGGHLPDATNHVQKALADAADAVLYVKTHPEINPLAIGPLPAETLPAEPAAPQAGFRVPGLNMLAAIDALNAALYDVTNLSLNSAGGPVLGSIGGYREKIVADIGQAASDVLACIDYANQVEFPGRRGGPAATRGTTANFRGRATTPAPKLEATTQSHLDATQYYLGQALSSLNSAAAARFGGHTESAITAVEHTQADLAEATAYVKAHPESNSLQNGPAPAETSPVRPGANQNGGFPRMVTALNSLNNAFGPLLNNPSSDYTGPIIGDIGGYRATLLNDIDQAAKEVLAGLDYANAKRGGRRGNAAPAATTGDAGGNGGARSIGPPPPAAGAGSASLLPTVVSGIALSFALCLGGLHFLAQRGVSRRPLAVFFAAALVALIAGVAYGHVSTDNPPAIPMPELTQPPPASSLLQR